MCVFIKIVRVELGGVFELGMKEFQEMKDKKQAFLSFIP
jgi:hypothetical protein